MTVPLDDYPKNFFEINITLLKLSGMWHPEKNLPIFKRFARILFNFTIIFYTQIIYTPLEIAYLNKTYKNLNLLMEHLGIILTHLLGTFKLVVWFYNRRSLQEVMDLLHDEKYRYEEHGDFKPSQIFESNRRVSKIMSLVLFVIGQGVPLSKIFASLDIFMVDENTYRNTTCFTYLPYLTWVPFDTTTRNSCALGMIFELIPISIYVSQIVAHDVLFASILNCIKAHFVILQGAFATIRPRCLKRLGLKDENILHDADIPALEKEMYLEMKKSTVHLQTLIEIRNKFEDVFTYVTLIQALIALFVTVTNLFMVSSLPLFSGEFNAQFEYFAAIMIELIYYSWFGNEITLACSGLLDALYNSDWLSSSGRFKKCILINMVRLHKPYYITIGKFSPLTLRTFVSVLRGAYSYYAVLNKKREHLNG